MNDPDQKPNDNKRAESLSGATDRLDDTVTTMRLKTLELEGELWPDESVSDIHEDDGVYPYNTGRFDRKKH